MAGVIPVSLALTIWQLITQKGIRLGLLRSREAMDGTVVEQLGGPRLRPAPPTPTSRRSGASRGRPSGSGRRSSGTTSRCRCSAAARRSTRGSSTSSSSPSPIYLFVNGRISFGDILTFSMLFLNVMAPLNEVHRFIDEAHESSLRWATCSRC